MLYLLYLYAMSSVALNFRTSKINKDGQHPLYIRIIKNRKTQFISLGIHLKPEEWDEKKNKVKSKHPNSARLNSYIAQKLSEALDISFAMHSKDINTTSSKIKEKLKGKSAGSFTDFFEKHSDWLLANDKISTYLKTKANISKLNQFTNNRKLQFEDIDVEFLKSYELFLSNKLGNSINTIHSSIKIIRKLFNDASREGIIEFSTNPFLRFKIKTEKTTKIYLTEEEIERFEMLELTKGSRLELHRDVFLFACFAAGMRVSDLLQLRWKDFSGTNLNIITQKTREHISVKIPDKALIIIEKYRGSRQPSDLIFPIMKLREDSSTLELYRAISASTAYINKDLKELAKLAKIEAHISMHTSRHTWATRALQKGMRLEYVSKLMGHASIKTTQIYAKIVNSELDKAMEVFND